MEGYMKTWEEIANIQPLASKIITNSITKNRISHAYLLQGERGTGKEAIALLLAKVQFCEHLQGVEPCQKCNMCKRIESRNHPDVHWIEPEGQSIKIEQIKDLQKEFTYSGLESDQKVYIVKNAETLTANAANRILKFLEEPSKKTIAIMLTENSQAILPTIRSRCQVIDLQPLNQKLLQKQMIAMGIHEHSALLLSTLTNNIDEAVQLNNDDWFAQSRKLMIQLVKMLATKATDVYLFIHSHLVNHFKERKQMEQGLDLLLIIYRDILYFHIGNEEALVWFKQTDEQLEELAMHFTQQQLVTILEHIMQAKRHVKQNVHPTFVLEQLVLQIKR